MIAAMPALVLGLARGIQLLRESVVVSFLAAVALTISLDSVCQSVLVPESGLEGESLRFATINELYPWSAHFIPRVDSAFPLLDLAFWGLLFSPLALKLFPVIPHRRPILAGSVILAALAPAMWGQSDAVAGRLGTSLSDQLRISDDSGILDGDYPAFVLNFDKKIGLYGRLDSALDFYVGGASEDGRQAAGAEMPPGMLGSARIPRLGRGLYGLSIPRMRAGWEEGWSPGVLVASLRNTVQVVSEWEHRISHIIAEQPTTYVYPLLEIYNSSDRFGYLDVEYTGRGSLSLKTAYLLPLLNKRRAWVKWCVNDSGGDLLPLRDG